MAELLQEIFNVLELVPTNVSFILLGIILVYIVREQLKVNKKTEDRLAAGSRNFEMIDGHFLRISEHFNKIENQIKEGNEEIRINMDAMHRMILKDIIYNESMDPHERQEAYDKYVALGGNGMVKQYYEQVLRPRVVKHIDKTDSE